MGKGILSAAYRKVLGKPPGNTQATGPEAKNVGLRQSFGV